MCGLRSCHEVVSNLIHLRCIKCGKLLVVLFYACCLFFTNSVCRHMICVCSTCFDLCDATLPNDGLFLLAFFFVRFLRVFGHKSWVWLVFRCRCVIFNLWSTSMMDAMLTGITVLDSIDANLRWLEQILQHIVLSWNISCTFRLGGNDGMQSRLSRWY